MIVWTDASCGDNFRCMGYKLSYWKQIKPSTRTARSTLRWREREREREREEIRRS